MTPGQRRQPVTRSTMEPPISLIESPISFTLSTPSVTAAVVWCAISFATRATRASGFAFFAGARLATFFGLAFFALIFFAAFRGPRFAALFAAGFDFFALRAVDFFIGFFALLPAFPRDFLARVAMTLLPGVGGEQLCETIARSEH